MQKRKDIYLYFVDGFSDAKTGKNHKVTDLL